MSNDDPQQRLVPADTRGSKVEGEVPERLVPAEGSGLRTDLCCKGCGAPLTEDGSCSFMWGDFPTELIPTVSERPSPEPGGNDEAERLRL